MTARRINILGASGTGSSTLARALATALSTQSFDVDDFYWQPTDPPFQHKRPIDERLALMEGVFLPRADWILAGSMVGWGDSIVPRLTHVVFLSMDRAQRLARLRARERRRNGDRIAPGGDLVGHHRAFLDWAMSYDDPTYTGRSRAVHESWLSALSCPVIRLDAVVPAEDLVTRCIAALDADTRPAVAPSADGR